MEIQEFYNRHKGVCLVIGNGSCLNNVPMGFLRSYPSFGSNLIYNLGNFKPTYYAAVDDKIQRLYARQIADKLGDVPKFIPSPDRDDWQGENFYRFHHSALELWPDGWQWDENTLTSPGITWVTITHVLLQLAYFMGFETMLCVGLDNTPDGRHFYGTDLTAGGAPVDQWNDGYGTLAKAFAPRKVINLSHPTKVTTLLQEDWRKYVKE